MFNIKQIYIEFENYDVIDILSKDIEYISFDNITKNFVSYNGKDCYYSNVCEYMIFALKPSANKEHLELGIDEMKTTVFDRIQKYLDICNIRIRYEDSTDEFNVMPKWDGNDYSNFLQKSYFNENGSLVIEIGTIEDKDEEDL